MEQQPIQFDDQNTQPITFRIQRWDGKDPETASVMQDYLIQVTPGMTVLEGLIFIKANLAPDLSWRASCRMGVCGSCGMLINGKPLLSCQQQILKLHCNVIEIKPLPNYPIIKDLVPDLSRLINTHTRLKPYIIRQGLAPEKTEGEFFQTEEELIRYLQLSYCLKCGLCMSACPTVGTLEAFPGPQPMAQALRYILDTRDEGFSERAAELDSKYGIFRCHFAGACSEACPKGIDPALAVQLLKKIMVQHAVFGKKIQTSAKILPIQQDNPTVRENIAPPPARTV